ncbi:RbsD/FucU family protein [Vibrio sp. TH_r3]|uniref:RbsD/FucU family protein n=1 Tax=Vibrio sp. TH_r3 TaxID=3082084 RepID=UPI002953AEDE|nr:RbsD/FucU family protein [Vibrio sp. TH_r3]MDV7105265.1 RbsD/FucU family protein [Vibrio sp. TH_r3]
MIKSKVIHPELLYHLSRCGHKTKILIADSNYSFVTNSPDNANIVYLNLTKGLVDSPTILDLVLSQINVEAATMMIYPEDFDNTVIPEYKAILPDDIEINHLERYEFYDMAKSDDTMLVIAAGEQRRFANLILTVGVVF